MNKYIIATFTISLLGCNYNPTSIEKTSEVIPPAQEIFTENNDKTQNPDSTLEPTTSTIILEIPEYNAPVESRYNLILEIPSNWGEVNWLADRGGYGWNEKDPWSFEIYGEHYTVVTTTYNESGVRFDEPIFMITSIPKEDKNHSAIPETDQYITEYKDHAYFIRFETNNQDLLKDIQDILRNIKFK